MGNDTAVTETVHGSDATLLLDLPGLAVEQVTRGGGGARVVRLVTADPAAPACPSCGVFSTAVKEYVCTRPRDLPCGGGDVELRWSKRRWYCRESVCGRESFTESVPAVPARSRLSTRLRAHAGNLVVDGVCATVSGAGRADGLSWPTTMDAVREQAAKVLPEAPAPTEVLGIDEVRRGRPRWQPKDPAPPAPADPTPADPTPADPTPADPTPADTGSADSGSADSGRVDAGLAEAASVPADGDGPARARVLADRWHVGFSDISGGAGMFGQVEGRTADDVAYWLASQTPAWRDGIRYVAIDMCTVFVSAVRRYLPRAELVVDHFHVVQLANDTLAEIRRHVATALRGRRGRATDPEYQIRNLLRRNSESLTPKAFAKLWNTLVDLGEPGQQILTAWIAKEELRALLALSGPAFDRAAVSRRLYRFYTWCADSGIAELHRLATTISTWWPAIETFLRTKITNAKSEGYNRVVKLDARNAYGYRNPANQRLRSRCATTRRARGCFDPG